MCKNSNILNKYNNFEELKNIESIVLIDNWKEEIPLYTIAIPTYNRANLLKEALESAIHQNYHEYFDILIIDNNSTRFDSTELLMKSYESISGIKYCKNSKNIGMAGNWNMAFSICRTKYLVLLHDDDVISKSFLYIINKVVNNINRFAFIQTKKDSDLNKITQNNPNNIKIVKYSLSDFLFGNVVHAPSGILFNVEYYKQIGGAYTTVYPSIDYHLYILMTMYYPAYYICTTLTLYRICDNLTFKNDNLEKMINIDIELISALAHKYKLPNFLIRFWVKQYTYNYLNILKKTYGFKEPICIKKININNDNKDIKIRKYIIFVLIDKIRLLLKYIISFRLFI